MAELSVLFPVYNEEIEYVRKSLESILNQTFSDFILYVVLDNPENNRLENFIKEYQLIDKRIVFSKNKSNMGLPATLNFLISKVETKYIARMDADDIAMSNRFQIQYDYMEKNTSVDLCGTNVIYINEDGKEICLNKKIPQKHKDISRGLKLQNCMFHPTYFAKTEMMKKVLYREQLRYAQDYDFVCRCVESGYILANIDECLLYYRLGSISEKKRLFQIITTYYVKKYYRQKKLRSEDDISEQIEMEIKRDSKNIMLESISLKKCIHNTVKNIRLRKFGEVKKNLIFIFNPSKYKIDVWIGILKYKFFVRTI